MLRGRGRRHYFAFDFDFDLPLSPFLLVSPPLASAFFSPFLSAFPLLVPLLSPFAGSLSPSCWRYPNPANGRNAGEGSVTASHMDGPARERVLPDNYFKLKKKMGAPVREILQNLSSGAKSPGRWNALLCFIAFCAGGEVHKKEFAHRKMGFFKKKLKQKIFSNSWHHVLLLWKADQVGTLLHRHSPLCHGPGSVADRHPGNCQHARCHPTCQNCKLSGALCILRGESERDRHHKKLKRQVLFCYCPFVIRRLKAMFKLLSTWILVRFEQKPFSKIVSF